MIRRVLLRLFYGAPPGTLPTCDTAGVIGPIVNVIGSLVLPKRSNSSPARGSATAVLINIDLWENTFDTFELRAPTIARAVSNMNLNIWTYAEPRAAAYLCGRNAIQSPPQKPRWIWHSSRNVLLPWVASPKTISLKIHARRL